MQGNYVLGIDTSNYKTSVAVMDRDGRILYDAREYLSVRRGERGLRQSEALFQHIVTLPRLIERIPVDLGRELAAVAWSDRPRPVEGSYMPVFLAGASVGRSIASACGVQGLGFSHQEGHIEAIRQDIAMEADGPFLACHFSGGTTEILLVRPGRREEIHSDGLFYHISQAGGTKDIAYGQVLDRAGVALGLPFPAGEAMDEIACQCGEVSDHLTRIRVRNASMNLSGIDSQVKRLLDAGVEKAAQPALIRELFSKLAASIEEALLQASGMTGTDRILMAGGVASSRYLRRYLEDPAKLQGISVRFGKGELSQDNAVGIASLGRRYLWD